MYELKAHLLELRNLAAIRQKQLNQIIETKSFFACNITITIVS